MARSIASLYSAACYAICFVTCIYAVGFVSCLAVPKTIDSGAVTPAAQAFAVDSRLIIGFAAQHSWITREPYRKWWIRFVPVALERSTYVLFSSLALAFLFWQWRPMPAPVWQIGNPSIAFAAKGISVFGWVIVRTTCFIKNFELLGLHQAARGPAGCPAAAGRFAWPLFKKLVRHPMYLGFMIAFWVAPTMTAGHLLFATATTAYIFIGIWFEQRNEVGYAARQRLSPP